MPRAAGFHLHLYQPPRENPWTGLVPNEWSAWPYHDWNERITTECYRALIAVALPRSEDGATELFEPLVSSSFDVGPTLHDWLERCSPDVDRALRHQVRHVASSPSSVAMAAPLVHSILPLASAVDRDRLVAWGVADYVRRFGEAPLGMWLPETGVDLATLEALVRHGIRYTVLMPGQAARVRDSGGAWRGVNATSLDTSRPYTVRLSEGRSITVVFGQGGLSQAVAFGDLIEDGTKLADAMMDVLGDSPDGIALLVADGETYGHHHRFGDLGLAWALRHLQRHYGVATTLGDWLLDRVPLAEVELLGASSWSCAHGVERWRADCGCTTGSQPGWHQGWRAPLRQALDWLRDALGDAADAKLANFVRSVDDTLGAYGEVIAGALAPVEFVAANATRALDDDETSTVLELCEVHRNLAYSFTSCAWFFADPAAIETGIVLRYAAVAIELGQRSLGRDFGPEFLARLAAVRSNEPGLDGATIWRRATEPYRFDEPLVAAGFAVELLACGNGARRRRGVWIIDDVESVPGECDGWRLVLTHGATLRRRAFVVRAERTGSLGARVGVTDEDPDATRTEFGLAQLGSDVIARVAASWLVREGSLDFEEALDRLVSDVLVRPAGDDDAAVLVALAGAMRCVSPSGEASIRRALLAVTGRSEQAVDFDLLSPLALAVGLPELVGRPRRARPGK